MDTFINNHSRKIIENQNEKCECKYGNEIVTEHFLSRNDYEINFADYTF